MSDFPVYAFGGCSDPCFEELIDASPALSIRELFKRADVKELIGEAIEKVVEFA